MHDIDSQINKLSGNADYMQQLAKITGNINQINIDYYKYQYNRICSCEFVIEQTLLRLYNKSPNDTVDELISCFKTLSSELNLRQNYITIIHNKRKKCDEEIVNMNYSPNKLFTSEWFKVIKTIERNITKTFNILFETINEENKTFETLSQIFKTNPEKIELYTIYNIQLNDINIYKLFKQLSESCRVIINIILHPMYDTKLTIKKNWKKIEVIFKTQSLKNEIINPSYIIEMLDNFIIAKYRTTLTGNSKHYLKLFLNVIGDDTISKMDGARFIEIMDTIDLSNLSKTDKVYKFANAAKITMNKLVNNNSSDITEVLKMFDEMFDNATDNAINQSDNQDTSNTYSELL